MFFMHFSYPLYVLEPRPPPRLVPFLHWVRGLFRSRQMATEHRRGLQIKGYNLERFNFSLLIIRFGKNCDALFRRLH
jgi:hypothetical protein